MQANVNTINTTSEPVFSIEKLFVKEMSVSVPNAPQIFLEREAPQISVKLHTEGDAADEGVYEVRLNVQVEATLPGDKTVFLVEVVQAGVFQIRNVSTDDLELIMHIACANILFPYAREAVSDAVTRAGFQPVILAPVNFEMIYKAQQTAE